VHSKQIILTFQVFNRREVESQVISKTLHMWSRSLPEKGHFVIFLQNIQVFMTAIFNMYI